MNMALAVDGLHVATAATGDRIVHGVSFALAPGEAMTLLGESGSGKSLLAQAILGVLPANLRASGTVTLQGESVAADRPAERRRWWGRRLALLPQEPWFALDPTMRVGSQLAETHRWVRGGLSGRQAGQAAAADLHALGLAGAGPKYPYMLSGGMAQRAAFAIARAGGAPVLIVDEPTKGLDADRKGELVATLQRLLAEGGSVLAISHDTDIARALGGQAAVMLEGRLVEHGRAADVLDRPQHAYTRALLQAAPLAWPAMAGAAPSSDAARVLRARGLAKRFGTHALFEALDLDIARGERIAISGPSGSGKSTLGNLLLGLVRADSGSVERAGGTSPLAFQKLYQDPTASFAPRRTLRHALADLAARHRLGAAVIEALADRLRLGAPLLDRLPRQLSGGEMQRFAMVRVLALRPAFVFADEPTSRLDPITQRETFQLLMDSVGDIGCAVAVVTHDPQIAAKVATRTLRLGASS